uniref:TERF1-interacting nuclear factor 2 N-terminal domain-containing protein n=1 Tax=Podarcis muralis TaxID=64176 RepID=A0A670KCD1_PODMU
RSTPKIHGAAPDPCVALRLVAAAAWHVVQKQQVHDFPRVLALLAAVKEAAPDLVHFRHYAKLRLGLQAKVSLRVNRVCRCHAVALVGWRELKTK